MIAKIKEYFGNLWGQAENWRDREIVWESREKIEEGRRLLEAIAEPMADKSPLEIMAILAGVGLAHLRAFKTALEAEKAVREMGRRIQEGPRPSREEAGLN